MLPRLAVALAAGLLTLSPLAAQPPADVEVLARGPVHEAFATTAEFPQPGPVVGKPPPPPIEELPPDQRPAGDNVQWLPGYWHFDDERQDYVWISGFWRVPPPGRVWVPGSWQEVAGGFQWTAGFWQDPTPPAPQQFAPPIEYLPPPPPPAEVFPSVPQPHAASVYVPGSWVWRGRYLWRPGFWMDVRPGWVWVPAHFRCTPVGYVFIEGYWDRELADRGVLFAPVAFAPAAVARPQFVYTPAYVVPPQPLCASLFVRRGFGAYFFGDFFEPRYAQAGFSAFASGVTRGGTSIGFNLTVGGRPAPPVYDPLWAYYRAARRDDAFWGRQVMDVYAGRFRGDIPRPPRTLAQQNQVVNNTTIVTNTTVNTVTNVTMVAPITTVQQVTNNAVKLQAVPHAERVRERELAQEVRNLAVERRRLERELAQRPVAANPAAAQPRQVNLAVPQAMLARAQTPPPAALPPGQPAQPPVAVPPPPPTRSERPQPAPSRPQRPDRGQRPQAPPGQSPPPANPPPAPRTDRPDRPPVRPPATPAPTPPPAMPAPPTGPAMPPARPQPPKVPTPSAPPQRPQVPPTVPPQRPPLPPPQRPSAPPRPQVPGQLQPPAGPSQPQRPTPPGQVNPSAPGTPPRGRFGPPNWPWGQRPAPTAPAPSGPPPRPATGPQPPTPGPPAAPAPAPQPPAKPAERKG
jgi:hypothetical protein